jgi:hypothetical protein
MTEPESTVLTEDAQTTQTVWKDTVLDEHKELVENKGWNDTNSVIKSYTELERAMGSRIKIPDENAGEEELSNFYLKLGRPETAEGYEVNVPESVPRDEDFENTMRNIAFKTGAPKAQFEALVKGYYEFLDAKLKRTQEEGEKNLRDTWKADYDQNIEVAKRAFKQFGGDEFSDLLVKTRLGNHPAMVKAFYEIGKVNMDDTLIRGTQTTDEDYVPQYKDSPDMYATGDDEESKKARAYFEAKGHKY